MRPAQERRAAVIALYQHDATGRPLAELFEPEAGALSVALATAAAERSGELDALIDRHARGWRAERLQPLERSILRIALVEMIDPACGGMERPIPPEGAIAEAVAYAKRYCSAQAPGFINGVLDAALRELRENGGVGKPAGRLES